jgi:hypothetical protein
VFFVRSVIETIVFINDAAFTKYSPSPDGVDNFNVQLKLKKKLDELTVYIFNIIIIALNKQQIPHSVY